MSRLKVYINNSPVILRGDSGVFLNFEANSLENLSQRSGTLSEEFELEDCPQNRAALGNSHIVTSIENTPYELLPTRLEVNGNFFMAGSASISEYEESFPVSFASDNADFFQRIKGKAISEIDLSEFDHAYTVANVQDFNVHDFGRGFFYPVINYGRWDSRFYDATNQEFWELYPAVYVRTLLERMAAPYTLTGALLSEERFNRLAVAFTNETFSYRESYRAGYAASARPSADVDLSNDPFTFIVFDEVISDPAGQIATGTFTADQAGYYSFIVEVGFNIFSAFTGKLQLIKPEPTEPVLVAEAEVTEGVDQVVKLEGSTFMYAGETVVIGMFSDNSTPGIAFAKDDSVFKAELLPRVVDGGPVHLEANLPDIKQDELLAAVVNMFDVLIQTNDLTKTISFDFRRDMSPATALDWSGKVDYSKRIKTVFKPEFYGQENIFAYAENEETDPAGNPVIDSMHIPLGNANSEPEKEVFTSVFTNTLNKPAFRNARVLPRIPIWAQQVKSFGIWRDGVSYDAEDYVYYPDENGIFYWMATQPPAGVPGPGSPGGPPTYWIPAEESGVFKAAEATPRLLIAEELPAGSGVSVGKYILGAPVNHEVLTWSAKFATDNPALSIQYDTLRQEYYGMLERILAKPKFITVQMRLTPADVTALDFTRMIRLNIPERNLQGLFYLRKVNQYNPEERAAVAVELALIGTIPAEIGEGGDREHSNEFSNEYA